MNPLPLDPGHETRVVRYAVGRPAIALLPAVDQVRLANQRTGHGDIVGHAAVYQRRSRLVGTYATHEHQGHADRFFVPLGRRLPIYPVVSDPGTSPAVLPKMKASDVDFKALANFTWAEASLSFVTTY